MNESQQMKRKFRSSKLWTQFRKKIMLEYDGKDAIVHRKLTGRWCVHHLDSNEENYKDVSDISHFMPLLKSVHDSWHIFYKYWLKDPEVLDRLKASFELAKSISEKTTK